MTTSPYFLSPSNAPPTVPGIEGLPDGLTNYLRTFSLWCYKKFQEQNTQAVPSLLLLASDPAPGTVPKVFKLTVNTAGTILATAVPLGGGQP